MNNIPNFAMPKLTGFIDVFIQVYAGGKPYFRAWSNYNYISDYHGDVFEAFLNEAGLSFETFMDDYNDIFPAAKGKDYEIVGGGNMRFRKEGGFKLFSKSGSYKIGPNQKHLDDLAPFLPEGIKISIENRD